MKRLKNGFAGMGKVEEVSCLVVHGERPRLKGLAKSGRRSETFSDLPTSKAVNATSTGMRVEDPSGF